MTEPSDNTGNSPGGKRLSVQYIEGTAPPRARSLNTQIRSMLVDCPSRQALFEKVLHICTEQLPATVGRVDFRVGSLLQSRMTHNPKMANGLAQRFNDEYLSPVADSVMSSGDPEPQLKNYERGEQKMTLISAPVIDIITGKIEAAVTLMLAGGAYKPEVILPRLDGIVALASAVLAGKAGTTPVASALQSQPVVESTAPASAAVEQNPEAAPAPETLRESAPVSDIQHASALAKTSQFKSTKEFGYSLVNSICGQMQAEQVIFGVQKNQRVIVEAVSGTPDFKPSGPGVTAIRQAMEECVDQGNVMVAQHHQPEGFEALPIHKQWATDTNNSCVCSIPLTDGTDVTGVVSIRRSANKPFKPEEVSGLQKMLAAYGSAIPVVDKANRTMGTQLKTAVGDSARSTFSKGSIGRKVTLIAFIVGMLWFVFGTLTYRPLCRTRVTAADMRHFSSPFDGKLKQVYVKPGQLVEAGELLAEFDTADLQLELNSLKRQVSATTVEFRQAIDDKKLPEAALAKSQLSVLDSQKVALQKRIDDAKIVAPENGVVLISDLEQRIGQVFQQGDEILQFAANGDWLLEIEVPDDIVSYVAPEQSGTFAAASAATQKLDFRIEHIDGAASTIEDRNVFIARAPLQEQPDWMRTGMEGTARIQTVDRPVWWVAMHRVVDWGRRNFWL